jgi:TRAP transporter 4TM/12TM fusion protein
VDLRREGEQHGIPDAVLEQISDDLEEFEAEGVGKVELEQQTFADSVSGTRADMHGVWRVAVFVVALVLSGFHLYTAVRGLRSSLVQGSFHLALGLCLIFLLYPSKIFASPRDDVRGWALTLAGMLALVAAYATEMAGAHIVLPAAGVFVLAQAARHVPVRVWGLPVPDLVLSLAGLGAGLYVWYFSSPIERAGGFHGEGDMAVATVGILLVLLATQRVIGTPLVVVAVLALAYTYWGQSMPGFLAHGGFSVDRIVSRTFLGTEGIFGTPIRVSSTFIFIFLIFAALLQRTGMERFFTQAAFGLTGWMTGGTAKVGVLTSAFSGTITGSSVANTVSNGAFTIPMMKKSGYKGEFAGAVEAASSTGGQLAPPVMGAAAFIMIEFTRMPYVEIIKAAAIPAILFFTAQFIVIHYESKRVGIRGLPREQLPNVWQLLLRKGYLLIPIGVIFYVLMAGFSVMRAAWYAVVTTVVVNLVVQLIALPFGRWRDMEDRLTVTTFLNGLVDAARIALPIIAACAAAGIIAGVITTTGIGLQLAGELVNLAGENVLITMFFVMIACLILGIGLPTTANYVITATMAAPALLFFFDMPETAVALLSAHLFVYYFGIMADITPPVCLAAYAASGVARSNPLRTGVQSVRIAIGGFLLPYMFFMSPQLLLLEWDWFFGPKALVTALVGIFAVGTAVVGFIDRGLSPPIRLLLLGSGLLLLYGELITDIIGLAVFALIFFWQWWTGARVRRRDARDAAATSASPPATEGHLGGAS